MSLDRLVATWRPRIASAWAHCRDLFVETSPSRVFDTESTPPPAVFEESTSTGRIRAVHTYLDDVEDTLNRRRETRA